MVEKKKIVYICSSIGFDYFFFLEKILKSSDFDVKPIYLISEEKYRTLSKAKGFKKIYLRFQMYVTYPLLLIYKGLLCSRDAIFIVTSNTFFAPLLVKIVTIFKKNKIVHLLYDLYPDAIEIAGLFKSNGKLSKIIGLIIKKTQSLCDATVYLGEFLREHTEHRWGKPKIGKVIDISTDISLFDPEFKNSFQNEKIIIHYGGQLGYLHDAISIVECLKCFFESDLKEKFEFNFYVSGAQAEFLRKSLSDTNVKIKSAINSEIWRKDIRNFHIGLVSLSPGGASVCLPSKTYSMMAGGLSILGICPNWSDLANLIKNIDAGWVVNNSIHDSKAEFENDDYLDSICEKQSIEIIKQDFMNVLNLIINEKELLFKSRRNSFKMIRQLYSIDNLGKEWSLLLNNLI